MYKWLSITQPTNTNHFRKKQKKSLKISLWLFIKKYPFFFNG